MKNTNPTWEKAMNNWTIDGRDENGNVVMWHSKGWLVIDGNGRQTTETTAMLAMRSDRRVREITMDCLIRSERVMAW